MPFLFICQMGMISLSYVFFASIALFSCVLQLIVSFNRKAGLTFLVGAVLSLVIFISFTAQVLCQSGFGIDCEPLAYYKFSLLAGEAALISMLVVLTYLLNEQGKIFFLSVCVTLAILVIATAGMNELLLFGDDAEIRALPLRYGDHMAVMTMGISTWRVFWIAAILIFIFACSVHLFKKWGKLNPKDSIIVISGFLVLLVSVITDCFIDLGQLHIPYTLPFALFINYLILSFISFIIFIRDINIHEKMIREEKWYRELINSADFIVVGLNRMGLVEYINPYFYKLTGYIPDEVIGKDWFAEFIPKNEYNEVQGAFLEVLENAFHPHYVNTIITKNGELKVIKWFNFRTVDMNSKINGSLSVGFDITEDVTLKESLSSRLREAELLIEKIRQNPSFQG